MADAQVQCAPHFRSDMARPSETGHESSSGLMEMNECFCGGVAPPGILSIFPIFDRYSEEKSNMRVEEVVLFGPDVESL